MCVCDVVCVYVMCGVCVWCVVCVRDVWCVCVVCGVCVVCVCDVGCVCVYNSLPLFMIFAFFSVNLLYLTNRLAYEKLLVLGTFM